VSEGSGRVVPVEIFGQRYPIRSDLDERYVTELAAYVDGKIRAVVEVTPEGDSIGLAVLAALNIADELFRFREAERDGQSLFLERAAEIERLVDEVLAR
jgi:cell division protein ZapA